MFFQPVFLQDNALGMPIDQSALLMVAFCSSQAQILDPSMYHSTPAGTVPPPIGIHRSLCTIRPRLQRRLQVMRIPHRGPNNRVGQNLRFREGKENNAAILDQYLLEPKLALILPYLTNHQGMTTVHPGLPNTRQSYIP